MSLEETYFRRLPHLRHAGSVYFVTWSLAERGESLAPRERDVVAEALKHFEGVRYDLFAWVIMDDHVHVLVQPTQGYALAKLLHSWKSFSANRIQRLGWRSGKLWEGEYFDRIVRHGREFERTIEYIRNNPAKRWPDIKGYPWVWIRPGINRGL